MDTFAHLLDPGTCHADMSCLQHIIAGLCGANMPDVQLIRMLNTMSMSQRAKFHAARAFAR